MKEDRIIKLPVFRTMFKPVARKAWRCDICRKAVDIGERYLHYVDRQPHKIYHYRFHPSCFDIVMAYCTEKEETSFTPTKVRNWAIKTFCEPCKEECPLHNCKLIEARTKFLRKHKKGLDSIV